VGRSRATQWLSWLLGTAVFGSVIAAALHFSEERAFVRLAERAQPWWLGAAAVLQAGTYVAQGRIWRLVGAAADYRVSRWAALELAFAKLFTDQALPSAGLSSSVFIAKALERWQLPSTAIKAAVLVNITSYHLAYVAALVGALVMMQRRGDTNALVIVTAVLFLLFSLGLSVMLLALSGHRYSHYTGRLRKIPGLPTMLDFLSDADARLVRSPRVLAEAIGLQGAIVLLDAATVWTLIRALGASASASGVFASFMVASLFRTMGIVPGGLGTFEATSVLMLRTMGVDVAVALSATLLFRGLSFWLPMLPGYWCSRRALIAPAST
jgi:Mg2+-importing ATPase